VNRHHLFFSGHGILVHCGITIVIVRIDWYQLLSLVVYQQVLFEFLGLKLIWKADVFDLNLLNVLQGVIVNDYLIKNCEVIIMMMILLSPRSSAGARTWPQMSIVVDFVIRQDEHHLLFNALGPIICGLLR
jgi:hypothetical protein